MPDIPADILLSDGGENSCQRKHDRQKDKPHCNCQHRDDGRLKPCNQTVKGIRGALIIVLLQLTHNGFQLSGPASDADHLQIKAGKQTGGFDRVVEGLS